MEMTTTAAGAYERGTGRYVKGEAELPGSVACRLCAAAPLVDILDLGRLPLANGLVDTSALASEDPRFPLVLRFCPACSLVQIDQTVSPQALFRDYVYFSSYSDTMTAHARDLAARITTVRGLGPNSLVIEAASNDGYLLKNYRAAGIPVLGIEPAENVAAHAAKVHGIDTRSEEHTSELQSRFGI